MNSKMNTEKQTIFPVAGIGCQRARGWVARQPTGAGATVTEARNLARLSALVVKGLRHYAAGREGRSS